MEEYPPAPPPPPPPPPAPPAPPPPQPAPPPRPAGASTQKRDGKRPSSKPKAKQHVAPPAAAQSRKAPENHLNRDTPFVAAIKFRNQLPDLPCDPKLIARVLNTQELSKFHLTEIEKGLRPDIAVSFDPAVLSALNADRFLVNEAAGELHPDDRAIMDNNTGARSQGGSSVAWLMKTRYIHKTNTAAVPKAQSAADHIPALTLEEAKERIEESFADAKETAVHPRKPGLQPVSVMPVIPHMERYARSHVLASSTGEVVTHVLANGAAEEQRAALYERCLLRTYDEEDNAELGHAGLPKFMALLVPEQDASEGGDLSTCGEGRYMWAREFTPKAQDQSETGKPYVLSLSEEGAMWIPIEFNVQLAKRKRDDLLQVAVPSHVDVEQRQLVEDEARAHKRKMTALYGFNSDQEDS